MNPSHFQERQYTFFVFQVQQFHTFGTTTQSQLTKEKLRRQRETSSLSARSDCFTRSSILAVRLRMTARRYGLLRRNEQIRWRRWRNGTLVSTIGITTSRTRAGRVPWEEKGGTRTSFIVDTEIFAALKTEDVGRRRRSMRRTRRLQRRIGRRVRRHQRGRAGHAFDTFVHVRQPMITISTFEIVVQIHLDIHFRPQPLALVIIPIQRSQTAIIRLRPSVYLSIFLLFNINSFLFKFLVKGSSPRKPEIRRK